MNSKLRKELGTILGLTAGALIIRDVTRHSSQQAYTSSRVSTDDRPTSATRQFGNYGYASSLQSLGKLLPSLTPASTAFAIAALGLLLLPTPRFSFRGKSAVITGGSRGLGLAFARQLLQEGASVTILARDSEELERARHDLCQISKQVLDLVCDVRDPEQLDKALAESRARFGHIDLFINNAGSISVGPFDSLDDDDFKSQIDLHLKSVVQSFRLLKPYFKMNGGGRIINISSIGGKIPMPHMSAYCASKFAVGGLSEAVGLELRSENIIVTTAYPGLMRTGSPRQAVFKGDHEREFAWFAVSDNLPGLSVSAKYAAAKILDASREGRSEIVVSIPAKIGSIVHEVLPETFAAVMNFAAQLLPQNKSKVRKTGQAARGIFSGLQWLFPIQKIDERAARQYNQAPKYNAEANLGI